MPSSHPSSRPPSPRRVVGLGFAVLFVGSQIAACSTAVSSKDPAPPTDPPATVDEAESAFDAAEQDLQSLMVTSEEKSGERQGQGVVADDDGEPGADRPAPMARQQERRTRSEPGRCARACRALASMQRSADRLCELTGEGDERCQSVRVRVESAEGLVRRFCPECTS